MIDLIKSEKNRKKKKKKKVSHKKKKMRRFVNFSLFLHKPFHKTVLQNPVTQSNQSNP